LSRTGEARAGRPRTRRGGILPNPLAQPAVGRHPTRQRDPAASFSTGRTHQLEDQHVHHRFLEAGAMSATFSR